MIRAVQLGDLNCFSVWEQQEQGGEKWEPRVTLHMPCAHQQCTVLQGLNTEVRVGDLESIDSPQHGKSKGDSQGQSLGWLRLSWNGVPEPKGRRSSVSLGRASEGQEGALRALVDSSFVLDFCVEEQHVVSLCFGFFFNFLFLMK